MKTIYDNKIHCVVLAGGKGTRLDGKGKYSQILCNKTLLDHVVYRLSIQESTIAINFHNENINLKNDYEIIYDKYKENIGPLAGIHAAISYCINLKGDSDLVVTVPVDTPFIPLDLLEKFKNKIKSSESELVIASSNNRKHPTIAIWKTSVINKLEQSIKNNIRKIDVFTKELKKSYVNWDVHNYDPFYNINDHSDLKIAENMIKKNIIR